MSHPPVGRTLERLTMQYDKTHWFPFVEDENANITGPGHQQLDAFALLVNHYDMVASGETRDADEQWAADDFSWGWAVPEYINDEEFCLRPSTASARGAIPVTTLWGVR